MAAESIAQRAEQGEGEPTHEELFPMGSLEGDKITTAKLVKPGQAVECTVSMRKGEVPISGGGLLDPAKDRKLLVTCEPGKVEHVPIREDGKIKSWKARQQLRPIFVQPVGAGTAGDVEATFKDLLASDEQAAGRALKAMQAAMEAALT